MSQNVSLVTAYIGGLVAFFSPCLIPLLPSYFSIITGYTFKDLYGLNFNRLRARIFLSSVFFVVGFSIVFSVMGMSSSLIGAFLLTYNTLFARIGGALLILLGLMQLGVFHFEFLQFDYAWNVQRKLARLGYITAFITGVTFAFIWIPCIGAVLGAILLIASTSQSGMDGFLLLMSFSLGIGTPFLLLGLFFPTVFAFFQTKKKLFHYLSIIAGIIMVCFGIILLFGYYSFFFQLVAELTAALYRK